VNDVNESPTALDDASSVIEGGTTFVDVLANDTDPDNDTLSVAAITDPSQGTATIQLDDTITYVPDPGACGVDTFSYTTDDGNGESADASVTVTIQNMPPTANDDAVETQEAESVLIAVLSNDSDPGGNAPMIQSVSNPGYGNTLVMNDKILYTPIARYEGSDRFSYTIQDDCGASATAWVDIDVLHTNHPPEANAGMMYQGVVNEPLVLDASFSHDPDIGDTLQYRWNLNGSGVTNTGWLSTPRYTATYSAPFFGQIILEVRDVYRGIPTGEVSQATALVRIASLQSIQVFVFEDLDGNGVRDAGEPGMPGISITIDGEAMTTEADGGISVELDTGSWDIAMMPQAVSNLESRGFAVTQAETTVELAEGGIEIVALGVVKTSTKVTGFVYADLDENGEFNEDADQLLQGLRVSLDEERDTLTDDAGRFYFLGVPFGEHILWIGENVEGAEGNDGEDIPALFVPISLERGASTKFSVLWPWPPVGSDQGFLDVEVEKSGNR
ncbi:tandem-95 repeat protein, partial [Candidatus Bipolaricaulota bacterium]|nr:tandem-95 repeat protein [Candidatus Bipolaricaulota bacterium]